MAGFRKRVFASRPFTRNVRRKLTTRRGRFNRRPGGRTRFATQQYGAGSLVAMRGRKLGLKRWRRTLWNNTSTDTHYRSAFTVTLSQTTGTTAGTGSVVINFMESGATAADSFWLAANGAITHDSGGTVPTFNSDIILRGGKIGMTYAVADGVTDTVLVRSWLVFLNDDPDLALLSSPLSMSFEPTQLPDFATRVGSVISYRQAYLKYNQTVLSMEHRVRPRKIDRAVHAVAGKVFAIMTHVVNLTSATDVTVFKYKHYNFSFTGDAIT